MEERTVKLENAYFRNVLYVIEDRFSKVPRPAYEFTNPIDASITSYKFYEPDRRDNWEKQEGRITVDYSKSTITKYGIMAGVRTEKDPLIFECKQLADNSSVEVRGYYSTNKESKAWIMPIFEGIWQEILDEFSGSTP